MITHPVLESALKDWTSGESVAPNLAEPPKPEGVSIYLVDKPEDFLRLLDQGGISAVRIDPVQTLAFAVELRLAGVPVAYRAYAGKRGEWREHGP